MKKLREWFAKLLTYAGWMAIAEIIDALRIFPRVVLMYVLTFVFYDLLRHAQFFFDLPAEQKAEGSVVAFVTAESGTLALLLTATFALYNSSGRDWAAYHAEKRRQRSVDMPPAPSGS